jgi:hypothetical protein
MNLTSFFLCGLFFILSLYFFLSNAIRALKKTCAVLSCFLFYSLFQLRLRSYDQSLWKNFKYLINNHYLGNTPYDEVLFIQRLPVKTGELNTIRISKLGYEDD